MKKHEQQPGPEPSFEEVLSNLEYDLDFTHFKMWKNRLIADYENNRPIYHLGGKLAVGIVALGATAWGLLGVGAKAPVAEDVINSRQIELESGAISDGFHPAQTYMDTDGNRLNFVENYGSCFLSISTVERPVMAEPGRSLPENNYVVVNPQRDGSRSIITDFTTLSTLSDFTQCRIENSK